MGAGLRQGFQGWPGPERGTLGTSVRLSLLRVLPHQGFSHPASGQWAELTPGRKPAFFFSPLTEALGKAWAEGGERRLPASAAGKANTQLQVGPEGEGNSEGTSRVSLGETKPALPCWAAEGSAQLEAQWVTVRFSICLACPGEQEDLLK